MIPVRALSLWLLVTPLAAQEPGEPEEPLTMELDIDQAVAMALGSNIGLQMAEVEVEVSSFDELGGWGAFDWVFDASLTLTDSEREVGGFLDGGVLSVESESTDASFSFLKPLQTGGSFTASFDRGISESTSIFQNDPEQTTDNLSLVYTQPLLRGAWSEYATSVQRENELMWRRQIEVVRQTRQDVARQVIDAYWDLVSAIENLEVARSGVELGRSSLDREERELEAGIGTRVDVVQAKAELATRDETLLQAENAVEQRQDDLRKLLFAGQEEALWDVRLVPTTFYPETISTDDVPDWTTAVTTALDARSELRQKRMDVEAARMRLGRATSERLSGLDLNLSVNSRAVDASSGQTFDDSLGLEFPTYAATLSYNVPLGNRTARFAERAARGRVRSAQLDYERTELDVVAEVRAAVRDVHFAKEQVHATSESLRLAREQLNAEEALEENDLSTTFQVLEFQQSLIEAMFNERSARAGFAKAQVALRAAQGVLER